MRRPRALDRMGHAVAGAFGPPLVRLLSATLRPRYFGEEAVAASRTAGPVLFALWHGRLLPFVATHQGRGIVGLVSEHRDGEYIARVLSPLGFGVVRGSTTRGGARALWEMALRASEGRDLAITLDGPRGPATAVRPGVLALASRALTPIVPVGLAAEGASLPTWDHFSIPRPGARVAVVYGPPLAPPEGGARGCAQDAAELARRVSAATAAADAALRRGMGSSPSVAPLRSSGGEI